MTPITNERFITQMKLRELQSQRGQLLAAYNALEQDLAQTAERSQQIVLFYERLRDLTLSGHDLHPTVRQLDVLIHKVRAGLASDAMQSFWIERLQQEFATGQRRTDIMYLFGVLLEEWFAQSSEDDAETSAPATLYQEAIASLQQPAMPGDYQVLIDLFAGQQPLFPTHTPITYKEMGSGPYQMTYSDEGEVLVSSNRGATNLPPEQVVLPTFRAIYHRVKEKELQAALERIRLNRYRAAEIRAQASHLLTNPLLLRELSDALSIQLLHLDDWQWPEPGVTATLRWQRSQYRLYLDEDLPTTCLLEVLGVRWQTIFNDHLSMGLSQQVNDLRRLLDRNASVGAIQTAIERLQRSPSPFLRYHRNIWDQAAVAPLPDEPIARLQQLLLLYGANAALQVQRADEQQKVCTFHASTYHDAIGAAGIAPALGLIEAELALVRARFPERPIYIAKADITQFYASLSHEIILMLLGRLGIVGRELAFFTRYLAIPIDTDTQTFTSQRGVPINHLLSDTLAEVVLRMLDMYIQEQANVQVVRIVDDITLIASTPEDLARGWAALQQGLNLLGLTLNEAKCGAVAIQGQLPDGVPTTVPRWMMVTLAADGQWHVDDEQVASFRETTVRQVQQSRSVLDAISQYNYQITYLEQAVMVDTWLGQDYRQEMFAALVRFHEALADDEHGIIHVLTERLSQRTEIATLNLPEAWFYWPITAGGLALHEPAILAGSYHTIDLRFAAEAAATNRTAEWQHQRNEWSQYYALLIESMPQSSPQTDPVMETLVNDFIERGKDLSQGKQESLSAYWRWVLSSYGPQLLAAFGSFRFLFSELVPLHLQTAVIEAKVW